MEKLYNQLNKTGQYTKSLDEFKEQFGTPEKSQKLYTALNEAGDYTKSFEDFQSQFGFAEAGKINDSANVDLNVESQEEDMGSKSEDGSSESKKQLVASPESMGLKSSTIVADTVLGFTDLIEDIYKGVTSKKEDKAPEKASKAYALARGMKQDPGKTQLGIVSGAIEGAAGAIQTANEILFDNFIVDNYENLGILGLKLDVLVREGRFTTEEENKTIDQAAKNIGVGMPGIISAPMLRSGSNAINEKLQSYQTQFDNTITEEIKKGSDANWSEIAGRIVSGSIKSSPYSLMSMNKYTSAVLGLSIASDKFRNEFAENPDKATWKLAGNAITTGGIEMADAWLTRKMFRAKGLLKGEKIAGEAIKNLNKGISRKILDVAGLAGKEGLTEIGQSIATKINDQAWLGDEETWAEDAGRDIMRDSYEIIDEGIIGAFSGGGMATIQSVATSNKALAERAKVILMDPSVKSKLNKKTEEIAKLFEDRKKAEAEGNTKKEAAIRELIEKAAAEHLKLKRGSDFVLDMLEGNDLKTYADNIDTINSLSEGESSSLIKDKINALKQENTKILQNNLNEKVGGDLTLEEVLLKASEESFIANFEKSTKAATDLSTDLGFEKGPRVFETTDEYVEAVTKDAYANGEIKTKKQENALREKVKFSDGSYLGADRMFIDKQRASEVNSFNVSNHEILHPILNAIVGNRAAQEKVVEQFKKRMTRKQIDIVQKKLDASVEVENHATEFLTYFSDAIQKKEISYDKNIFNKIAEYVKSLFKQNGFENIDFQDGKQVYDFLKAYNQSILKDGKVRKDVVDAIKFGERSSGVKVKEAKAEDVSQASKTLADDTKASLVNDITEIKRLAKENAEVAAKFGKEPIKGRKQTKLEEKVLKNLEPLIEKVVTNRTKALYDKIADDAKRNVTRQEFQDSMRSDIQTMVLNEYTAEKQDLEKFIVNRSYLRANNLAKRLGIESKEDGGIKADVTAAKDIVATETEQSIDRSGSVERGQATFDQLDVVDDALISDIEKEIAREIRTRTQKGTLSETINVKKGRKIYEQSWLEDYVNKKLFKNLTKKLGAIGEKNGETTIPGAYIDFLKDSKTFDIITKALPIKSIKKSYGKLFPTERIGREETAEGNPVFRIKKIEPKTFLQYFLKGKKSTILERQKQLFREILTPVTKEVIANYATVENISELKEIQSLAPNESIDIISNISLTAKLENLQSQLDRYKGEEKSFDIIQFSKSIQNYTNDEITVIKKASGISLDTSKPLVMVEAITQIIKDTISPTATKLKRKKKFLKEKLGEDLFNKIENDFLYPLSDAYELKKQNNEYGLGTAAEQVVWDVYNKLPGIKVISPRPKGYSGDSRPDLIIQNNITKEKYVIEIKADKNARLVTFGVKNYTSNNPNVTRLTENSAESKSIIEQIKKDSPSNFFNKFLGKIDTYFKKNNLKLEKDNDGNIIIDKDILDILLGDVNLYSASVIFFETTNEAVVNDIYRNKDVSVLSFLDIGNFNIEGVKSMYDLPVFKADIKLRGYLKQHAIANTNKVKLKFKIIAEKANAATMDVLAETSTTPATSLISIKKSVNKNTNVIQFSRNKEFNDIIEDATGLASDKKISKAKGKVLGEKKGRFDFFIPPSAEDFSGLLYKLLGKGKKGENQQAWFKKNLFDPFSKGIRDFESYKENVTAVVRELKKEIKKIPQGLKKTNKTGFTNEVAVRVYLWNKNGYDIDGIDQSDIKDLVEVVESNEDLLAFATQMDNLLETYPEPQNDWLSGTITTDAINMINTTKRAEFLEDWQKNADEIFSEDNLNKLRASYGDNYVEALKDMLYRMETGRNRPSGPNKQTNKFMNWLNDSVATIMFLNTRSALLQTLSTFNFINWGDNNPVAAAKAFSNQKQFWSDFTMLFNSDFLKQRRSGLKNDINADDIANAAETSTNKTKAVLASILKKGFLPTQMADSFAIALGGASFIRNRINSYIKEGMSKTAAEKQAFLDFQEVAEESQQSSRPDRVSQQQASPLGRIILAFANTPMQYMRLSKKAFLDIKNGRGDLKTNLTKLAYYAAVQNIIFSSLQAALFASLFDDDEEELKSKELRVANSMLDTMLRGTGVYGAAISTLKNITMEAFNQASKDRPDFTVAAQRALSLSPPIDSKMRKLMSSARTFSYKTTREKMKGFGLDNPAYYAVGQAVSAATNIPLDRAIRKADNLRVAMDNDTKYWQSLALILGYSQWEVGMVETSKDKKKKKSKFGTTTKWRKKVFKKKTWKFN